MVSQVKVTYKHTRTTKNFEVFEPDASGASPVMGNLYISKDTFDGQEVPETITIDINLL